ncbi:Uncharacterised protein [Mycobacteroides abscessus subsp. abscessus]|nr:Uncharacterised protein [Mycobacteroides abscessus subsp. abscessus]
MPLGLVGSALKMSRGSMSASAPRDWFNAPKLIATFTQPPAQWSQVTSASTTELANESPRVLDFSAQ